MKWKIKKEAEIGDTRCVHKFAWKPTKVEEHIVWLEFYGIRQVLCRTEKPALEWISIEKYLLWAYI